MGKKYLILLVMCIFLATLKLAAANNYTADIYFKLNDHYFIVNERIELKGSLYLANYSSNGTLITSSSPLANTSVNLTIKNSSGVINNYTLTTDDNGTFYSRSNYYTTATEINASSTPGDYYIRTQYIDLNNLTWFSEVGIKVVNSSVDVLKVSSGKARYYPSESVTLEAEAIKEIGDAVIYRSGVSVNGTLRNSSDSIISYFNCTTGSNGKCTVNLTAPSAYDAYTLELDNFKATGSFYVIPFYFNIYMKDEIGKSFKSAYSLGEQARIEVKIANASTSDIYTFSGSISDSDGNVIKAVDSTTLNNNNSFKNSFLFTVDALTFNYGSYRATITVTKSGDGSIVSSTAFKVQDWSLSINKKSVSSGFEYEYSVFPNRTMNFEAYPTYRINGSVIPNLSSTIFTIDLKDNLDNIISSANTNWNSSCGSEGCYEFSLSSPLNTGRYTISTTLSYSGDVQTLGTTINVIEGTISAQSTNKEGALKELFGTNEYAYISLTSYNATSSSINLSEAEIFSIRYMNGSEFSYTQVDDFSLVNASNPAYEWAWNSTSQRIKLDVPKIGGIYSVFVFGNNRTLGTVAKFIVNPYDVCAVPKNTPGQVTSGYYYVWQFKTSDTVYFEIKAIQANNPLGKASVSNISGNSSGGMGSACNVNTGTQQVVTNATLTVLEVKNAESGALQNLNTTESTCQSSDSSGGYACTIKPLTKWEGGENVVKFTIQGQDGTADMFYSRFEARAFYLYGWSQQWQNSPENNVTLSVQMYEAGTGWWSGGSSLSGAVTVKKVEYQGRDGEWIWPPVDSGYNVSNLNSTIILGSSSSIFLPVSNAPGGSWKTGYYRVILQGTTSSGDTDYGYAWFGVKLWDVYGSPIECISSSCQYKSYFNSKENITLYIQISKAGSYSYSGGADIGGNVTVGIKKIQDCRTWPCKELNSTEYSANTINVNESSQGYWYSGANLSSVGRYIIQINKTSSSWGTGWYSVTLDVNGTDTGYAWFNTIAFYVDTRATDENGTNYKYNIKPQETMYFNVTTTKNYKGWGVSYNLSDFVNTTISEAVLRTWNQTSWQTIEYTYPEDINLTPTAINGNVLLNLTFNNGSWPNGWYWGELTLKNSENETSTGWLNFEVKPFRIYTSTSSYNIDSDQCVNATLSIYEPYWYSDAPLYGNYSIISVYENVWGGYSQSQTTYSNYTTSSFNASSNITICPNNSDWGSGSWGGYHYLNILVKDNLNNDTETGWLYFRAVPFQVQWGNIVGGSTKLTSTNIVVPVSITKYSTGENTTGNLTAVYQSRWDESYQGRQDYIFSVGNCFSNVSGRCIVNGTQNVTIYPPTDGWRVGYNYLYAEWTKTTDASSIIQDWNGIYIDAREAYTGYFTYSDVNGYYKYDFGQNENLTIKITTQNLSYNNVNTNITNVYYSAPSSTCYSEYCRSYTSATWSLVGGGAQTTNNSAIIIINVPSSGWTKGDYYIKVRVSGGDGAGTITSGYVRVKDFTPPNVTISSPVNNQTINGTTFTFSATTTKNSRCYFYLIDYNSFYSWYCGAFNSTNSTNSSSLTPQTIGACNTTLYNYNGSEYYYEYIGETYHSASNWTSYKYISSSPGLTTGGVSHSFTFNTTNKITGNVLTPQHYGIIAWCYDEDNNYKSELLAIKINVTQNGSEQDTTSPQVTINSPTNTTYNTSSILFNFTLNENGTCLYTLNNGATNYTMSTINNRNFNSTNSSIANGSYIVRAYCNDTSGNKNYTQNVAFTINSSIQQQINVTLVYPTNGSTLTSSSFTLNYTVNIQANCSQYWNASGWGVNSNVVNSGNLDVDISGINNGVYIWNVYCFDVNNVSNAAWASNYNWTFIVNASQAPIDATLIYPTNGSTITTSDFTFNYTLNIQANCSHYWNINGNWSSESNTITSGNASVDATDISNGNYTWNVYCFDIYNTSNAEWAEDSNWTFIVNASQAPIDVTLLYPTDGATINTSTFTINYSVNIQANCTLYSNISGDWSTGQSIIDSLNNSFDLEDISNGVYIWNVYCFDIYNTSNAIWGNTTANLTFSVNASSLEQSLLEWLSFGRTTDNNRYYNSSVDMTDFNVYWNFSATSYVDAPPIIAEGVVYVGSYDNNFYALNASTGAHLWNYTTGNDVRASAAIEEGIVYVGSYDNNFYALNATTGAHLWNYTTGDYIDSSPTIVDGTVYFGSQDNKTYALNASSGIHIWNYTTQGEIYSSPAIVDGILYIGSNDNKVYALNSSTGAHMWNYTTGNDVWSAPALDEGIVYFSSWDNKVYALNATNGSYIWNFSTSNIIVSSLAIANNKIYIGSTDYNLYALNATNGSQIWSYTTEGAVRSAPAITDNAIYFGSSDNKVYALNVSTGEHIWNYTTGDEVRSSPAIANGIVYIGSEDNKVYAFKAES